MLLDFTAAVLAFPDSEARRLNDLAVAVLFTEGALPGVLGEAIRSWLEMQTKRLLPEFYGHLKDFRQHPVPWRNQ